MIYLVIIEKFTSEGKRNRKDALHWQKRFDDWLLSHGAVFKSVKHFMTEIGEPVQETWLELSNYAALDENEEKSKEFAKVPEFKELISKIGMYFEPVTTRVLKETE
jgi:hypothetical protein